MIGHSYIGADIESHYSLGIAMHIIFMYRLVRKDTRSLIGHLRLGNNARLEVQELMWLQIISTVRT